MLWYGHRNAQERLFEAVVGQRVVRWAYLPKGGYTEKQCDKQ